MSGCLIKSGCLDVWMSNKVWMSGCLIKSGCLDVWMSECLDVWMSECLDAWMSECLDVWMSECLNVWMSEYLIVWMSDCLIACVFRHPDIQKIRHPDIQTSRHPDIQTSRHRCSRCPERNVQIWKISFAIQCDLGHPRAPPESQKNTACPVILDSGGARGTQKKARITRDIFKICTSFPGHSH